MTGPNEPSGLLRILGQEKYMNEPRWYCLSREGMATLCTDKADAEMTAINADELYPRAGPHRAVQLVEAAPQPQQAAPVAVPAGVKGMTTWRNLKTGCEGMHEAGSLPREVDAQPGYEYGTAFLIPAADAQWAMRHLDLLRNRVGDAAMQSLDCVRSWLNAWRVAASPQAAPTPPQQAPAPQPVGLTDELLRSIECPPDPETVDRAIWTDVRMELEAAGRDDLSQFVKNATKPNGRT